MDRIIGSADVPRVVEVIVYVQRKGRADWQCHLQHHGAHFRCATVAAGYDDLNAAHVGLWRYPGLEGLRPSQLADRVGITKQSVNDLIAHLELTGYLWRVPDTADGRARVIRLTSTGQRLEQTIYAAAGAAQLRIAEILGPRRFAQLHAALELLTEGLTKSGPDPV